MQNYNSNHAPQTIKKSPNSNQSPQRLSASVSKFPLIQLTQQRRAAEVQQQNCLAIDPGRIVQHYEGLRQYQYKQLAQLNISQDLKRLLFVFPQKSYLPKMEEKKPQEDMVIVNHPMRGRRLMSKQKYQLYMQTKKKERQIEKELSGDHIISQADIKNSQGFTSQPIDLSPLLEVSDDKFVVKHKSQQV